MVSTRVFAHFRKASIGQTKDSRRCISIRRPEDAALDKGQLDLFTWRGATRMQVRFSCHLPGRLAHGPCAEMTPPTKKASCRM